MNEPDAVSAREFAARLAARLCHDLLGPASGLGAGLDLLADPRQGDLHADAHALVEQSGRALLRTLAFGRAAFGHGEAAFDSEGLRRLAEGVLEERARLEWRLVAGPWPANEGRILLNLTQMAGAAVAAGGFVEVHGGFDLRVSARGVRATLHPEARAGLAGEPPAPGMTGRWAQGYYVWLLARRSGAPLTVEAVEGGVTFALARQGR